MDEEEIATARADAMEAIYLEVAACEVNWRLVDRLDLLWQGWRGI